MNRRSSRVLALIPLILLLAFALVPAAAFAAEETNTTSGYGEEPKKEEKKEEKPEKAEEPTKEPTAEKAAEPAKTLPFTGFDLRWTVVVGILLIGSGVGIVVVQQRSRRRQN